MGGQAEALADAVRDAYIEDMDFDAALRAAVNSLRSVAPADNERARLEVAVLEHGPHRRCFRRLDDDKVNERTGSGAATT
jgi:proteasome alpha subunit